MTLNGIFEEYKLKVVDYLKMDIEGTEDVVISEGIDWMERVRSMKIEIHKPATMDGVRGILKSNGFKCREDALTPKCIVAVR